MRDRTSSPGALRGTTLTSVIPLLSLVLRKSVEFVDDIEVCGDVHGPHSRHRIERVVGGGVEEGHDGLDD